MAFTVNDLRDLLEILRTMPEWKEALRRELLGEEILSLPGLIRELTKAIEENNRRLSRLEQGFEENNRRLSRLEQGFEENNRRLSRLEQGFEENNKRLSHLEQGFEENNKRLSRVERDVEVLKRDVANLKGDSLERKYRERPFVYFRRILRKPRVLTDSELDDLLSQAQADGVLSEAEVEEISRLDVVVRGRRITDDSPAYLAVEVSTKIDANDVERAARRATLLGKIPGVVALPVVAGEQIAPKGSEALKQTAVWTVLDGQAEESTAPSA